MLTQHPKPGSEVISCSGDIILFLLTLNQPCQETARIRNTLSHGRNNRQDIINQVEFGEAKKNDDWFDFPMKPVRKNYYKISLPMLEVGYFQVKMFSLPENSENPIWSEGETIRIKIDPADT